MRVRTRARGEKIVGEIRCPGWERRCRMRIYFWIIRTGKMLAGCGSSFQKRTNRSPPRDRNAVGRSNFQPRDLRHEDRLLASRGGGNRKIRLCRYPMTWCFYLPCGSALYRGCLHKEKEILSFPIIKEKLSSQYKQYMCNRRRHHPNDNTWFMYNVLNDVLYMSFENSWPSITESHFDVYRKNLLRATTRDYDT